MIIEYGSIIKDVKWVWPTEEIFNNWKEDFFKIDETEKFDIYLVGGFLEKINGRKNHTSDIDIILTKNGDDLYSIEKLIYEGTKLGIEKYNVFFDILWFEDLPIYANMKPGDLKKTKLYIISDKWIVDGEVNKQYKNIKQISDNLWEMESVFPSNKQKKLINEGFIYSNPLKLNNKNG